jgi:16S rRNA (guanine527-N7)-methyltransferase
MDLKKKTELEKRIKEIIANISEKNQTDYFKSLMMYAQMVAEWNHTHNIVSRCQNIEDVLDSICDSIYVIEFFGKEFFLNDKYKKIVDVGSGGGFPGIPLSILIPEKEFILVDSNRKKCSFLRIVKSELNLKNVAVLNDKFNNSLKQILIVTKAAISPANFSIIINGMEKGGYAILWATAKTKAEFLLEMNKLGGKVTKEYGFTLPSGKERLFLLITK